MENNKDLYANSLSLNSTSFEFAINFKKQTIKQTAKNQESDIESVALVRMSPQLAKGLYNMLDNQIKDYEDTYGEIPIIK